MDGTTQLRIEELKIIRENLLADAKSNLMFSKIYLSLSPITPLLMSLRNNNIDAKSILLNYLIIGVPLAGLSLFLERDTVRKLNECSELNEEIEFFADEDEKDDYVELVNKVKTKKIFGKMIKD